MIDHMGVLNRNSVHLVSAWRIAIENDICPEPRERDSTIVNQNDIPSRTDTLAATSQQRNAFGCSVPFPLPGLGPELHHVAARSRPRLQPDPDPAAVVGVIVLSLFVYQPLPCCLCLFLVTFIGVFGFAIARFSDAWLMGSVTANLVMLMAFTQPQRAFTIA